MNFEVEEDIQKSRSLVQMKVRDIIETLSPEFTHKVWGGRRSVLGFLWGLIMLLFHVL